MTVLAVKEALDDAVKVVMKAMLEYYRLMDKRLANRKLAVLVIGPESGQCSVPK